MRPVHWQVLKILGNADGPLSGVEILEIADDPELTHRHGVHQTCTILSRRGLIIKNNPQAIPSRPMTYGITPAGRNALQGHEEAGRSGIKRT